jgi:hypothetical protein
MWESNIYKDTVLRSSASLVAEEFDRLGKKNYSCEIELQQYLSRTAQDSVGGSPPLRQLHSTAAELKKTLRDEVNLSKPHPFKPLWFLPPKAALSLLTFGETAA